MAENLYKWEGPNPWLGLQTYQEGTRLWGRDSDITTLSDIVCNNLATIIFGKSGIGKSSLIHAGISPEIRKRGMKPVYIRLEHNTDIAYTTQIERTVSDALDKEDRLNEDYPSMGLWDFFHRYIFYSKDGHHEVVPVIIIDQFEEIYTLADANHKHHAQELFEEFADLLNNKKPGKIIAIENDGKKSTKSNIEVDGKNVFTFRIHSEKINNYIEDSNFHVVICLREDYLYYLERNTSKIPSFKINRYSLKALDRDSAKEVIIKPCPGLFGDNEASNIITKISTYNDEGKEEIDPTVLSIFLFKYYNRKGNVNTDNIISEFYADETKDISDTSLAYLEDHLITGEGFRHIVPYNDALSNGVTKQELNSLISSRIIIVEPRKGHNYIEFSHDVICPIANSNREHRLVKEQAKRLKRRILVVTILFVFAFFLVGSFAYLNQQVKNAQIKNASIRAHFMIAQGDVLNAVKLLLNIVPDKRDIEVIPETESVLNEAYDSLNSNYACVSILHHNDDVSTAEFSEDSRLIVTACSDGYCRIWNAQSGEMKKALDCQSKGMKSASFSKDANKVVVSFDKGSIQVWDILSENVVAEFGHSATVNYACFSPDGKYVVSASNDSTVRLWDANNGKLLDIIVKHSDDVNCAIFSNDGSKVVTSSEDGTSVVYDLNSKTAKTIFDDENSSVAYAEFNNDDTKIVMVTGDVIYLYDAITYDKEICQTHCHDGLITSVAFSPFGNCIATSSYDKTIKIWNIENGELKIRHTYKGHSNVVKDVVFSPDSRFIISTSSDNEARLWNTEKINSRMVIHSGMKFSSVTFSPNGKYIAGLSVQGNAKIWDSESGDLIDSFNVPDKEKGCNSIVFSEGSDKVVVTSSQKVWIYGLFQEGPKPVENGNYDYASFNGDNAIIAIAQNDSTKQFCLDSSLSSDLNSPRFCYDSLANLTFSRDNKTCLFVKSSDANNFYVLNLHDFSVSPPFKEHSKNICSVKYSNDGKRIISSSSDNSAIVWDSEKGIILYKLRNHSQQVFFSEFSCDDNYCATVSTDQKLLIWNASTGKVVATRTTDCSPQYTNLFSPTEMKYIVVKRIRDYEDDIIIYSLFNPNDLIRDFVNRFDDYKFSKEEKDMYFL